MASATQIDGTVPTPTVRIHIVSPNPEVPEHLAFVDVSVNETVADLKSRIQQAIPSKPPPERQRIIYQGRALMQQDLALHSVLGTEASHASNPFIFHLVLSPTNVSGTTTTQSHNPYQPTGLPTLPTLSNPAQLFNMPPRPASTSQMAEPGQHAAGQAQSMLFNPIQGAIQQLLQQQPGPGIHMAFAQNGRPLHHPHPPSTMNIQNSQVNGSNGSPPPWLNDPHMQMLMTQHQLHHQMQHDMINRGRNTTRFDPQAGTHPSNQTQGQFQSRDVSGVRNIPNMPNSTIPTQSHPLQSLPPTLIADATGRSSRPQSATRQFQTPGPLGPMHPAHFHAIRQNHLQNMQLDQMSQFAQLRTAIVNPLQGMRQTVTTTTTVYLLSSPRGAEALLMSPSGVFASPGYSMVAQVPSSQVERGSTVTNSPSSQPIPSTPTPITTAIPAQQTDQQALQQQQPPQPQVLAQPQAQQQDQVGDLLRILLPLGGQLWLIVRIIGFVYLFSGGRGWRNTIVLGIIAFIGFLAQTGVFNPLLRNIWRPIRQHIEGIVNSEQPPAVANAPSQTPQQMAERLIEERRGNDNTLRRAARRVERSALLFAASLIPGVGESQVRARERAEREQREAEERARQEAEQQAENNETDNEHSKQDEPVTSEKDTTQSPAEAKTADRESVDMD